MWLDLLKSCELCPRKCKVNRLNGEIGVCGIGGKPKISSAFKHFGEEKCLVGRNGSGTIFFTGCNLKCVYCQNYEISQYLIGKEIELNDLFEIINDLVENDAENINLVTPTHQIPFVLYVFDEYGKPEIPVVYNCGGYENPHVIDLLKDYVDIYMPDFKYGYDEIAKKYSKVDEYTKYALKSLEKMVSQKGKPVFNGEVLVEGILVRHLIIPNNLESSLKVLELLKPFKNNILLNLMDQYYPSYKAFDYMELSRGITRNEYMTVLNKAIDMGFKLID